LQEKLLFYTFAHSKRPILGGVFIGEMQLFHAHFQRANAIASQNELSVKMPPKVGVISK
jgi:hypothetical protein